MKVLHSLWVINTHPAGGGIFNGRAFLLTLLRDSHTPLLAALLLKEGKHLWQDSLIVHQHPSTCASAASASGSQKVISMAQYSLMAVSSSARASARRPIMA
jgi:hypothetical protein